MPVLNPVAPRSKRLADSWFRFGARAIAVSGSDLWERAPGANPSLSRILAVRMAATSVGVLFVLTFLYFLRDVSDVRRLQKATLGNNAVAIAEALRSGRDPAKLPIFKNYPQAYGFRVFDHRVLLTRRVLASANTRWLPAIQYPVSTPADPDRDRDLTAEATDLVGGFTPLLTDGQGDRPKERGALLIRRVSLGNHHYWVQTYMIGDPALAGAGVILDNLRSHVLVPALFFLPALTLAIFLTTRRALRPLRELSESANRIGAAVARGQALAPVKGSGMAKEFSDVAATINAVLEKLDHSLQLQKQFTSDVAHELRTPLAVLLLETSQLPASVGRDRIKTDLQELGGLVNELLRFAQAEDIMASESREVDIASLTRKVVEDSVCDAMSKTQSLEFDATSAETVVNGNAALLEIALRNLTNNAIKYSPPHTVISVRVEAGPSVIVEDRGPGIPAEHRERVFERFWRMDRQSGGGAGVGLALVRRIAELHGGSVRLQDRPGGGTRMTLHLAAAAVSTRTAKEQSHQSAVVDEDGALALS
jgi:signal transduction histidine kinase